MTTSTSSTRLRHDSDATFREWGLEFATHLAAIGLIQTADTGQINWATVTRAAANTEAGFEIWRFDDALQATSPIYIRFGYGTGNGANRSRIQMTVGVGTNGAGVITAGGSWVIENVSGGATDNLVNTVLNSYFCYDGGTLGFFWKTTSASRACCVITRTVDSDGVYDGDGAFIASFGNNRISTACMNFVGTDSITTKRTFSATASICHWPQSPAASLVGSDQQVACAYGTYPRFRPLIGLLGCLNAEFGVGVTLTATMVGATSHTYLASPDNDTFFDGSATLKPAIIWE